MHAPQAELFPPAGAGSRVREERGPPPEPDGRNEAGEFWTARQRQAARLHEVSYRACFKPQLPEYFIDRYSERREIVYDPFMGRGTTPVQAALMGRVPYGNDINPLSRALAEPRVNPPDVADIQSRLEEIPFRGFTRNPEFEREELLAFYHPRTLAQIEGLRRWLLDRVAAGEDGKSDRWIRMVALNRLTGHSPGFFSVYTMPPNQAVTVTRQAIINKRRNQTPPERDVKSLILKKSKYLLSKTRGQVGGNHRIRDEDCKFLTLPSDKTHEIPDESVSLTVTSPPFLDVVNYEQDNWLRCWFLGIDPKSVPIARHRGIEGWKRFIRSTFRELARITRPGGHVAFEVGEVRNGTIRLDEHVLACIDGRTFNHQKTLINTQKFTKTSNTWGITNNTRGTNTNRIVLLKKMGQAK